MEAVAIIGGTGLERLSAEFSVEPLRVETRFGQAALARVTRGVEEILFLSRHGETHGIAPHRINYRANITALVDLGVTRVLAANAVGSLRLALPPGSLVLPDDFIDFTRGRPLTYWDDDVGDHAPVVHTDFSQPYCPEVRASLVESAAEHGVELLNKGVYLCVDGPRFESPAEVRLFAQWGADVVGMTGLPEAIFAREAGLCYAAIAIVTNYCAGLTPKPVTHEEVVACMASEIKVVRELLLAAAQGLPSHRGCRCAKE